MYSLSDSLKITYRQLVAAIFLIAACTIPLSATAQKASKKQEVIAPWPTKPIRILVGFPGGSTPDMAARTLIAPRQLPVGAITAIVGVTLFLFLLRRRDATSSG